MSDESLYLCGQNIDVMVNDSEEAWLKSFCAGDEQAYKFFFEHYYQLFAHFAMKYVPDAAVCEDIVHEVIFECYASRRLFKSLESFKSFFYVSIKNRCLNYLEHKRAELNYLNDASARQEHDFFLDAIIEEEVYAIMHKTCKEFPDPLRQVFDLVLEGKSNEEIASVLGLSVDSVKSYKKRGKQILKKKLGPLLAYWDFFKIEKVARCAIWS